MVALLETASGVSAICIFLQLLPREMGNQDLNHSCWRCLTLGNVPKATKVCEILGWVSALNHNTEPVLFFLQWESITAVWCTRHSTSGNTVLIDSPLQTLWWRYFPHEGLKPPAQVPIVLCTYTRVSSSSGQLAWISLPSTLFHGNCSLKLNLLMFSLLHSKITCPGIFNLQTGGTKNLSQAQWISW